MPISGSVAVGRAMRLIAPLFGFLVLAGCGTKYQDMGISGGVTAQQITADTFRISAQGNGYTASTTIQDYVLLKAAETTKAAGASYFILVSAADAAQVSYNVTAPSKYGPGSVDSVVKPGQDAYIRILKPGLQVPGAFSADEIIQFTGPRVQRG
jgi:hypothetical protein